jgi:hypothetical protein
MVLDSGLADGHAVTPGIDHRAKPAEAAQLCRAVTCAPPDGEMLIYLRRTSHSTHGGMIMPQGDKSSYTDKQKRQAKHIEEGYEKKGVAPTEAKRRAWATENKVSGGGKKH